VPAAVSAISKAHLSNCHIHAIVITSVRLLNNDGNVE
jgi:hypothetical protein